MAVPTDNPDSGRTRRRAYYYVDNSVVAFEEDLTHEFKGHRNVTDEELPAWAYIHGTDKRSRRGIARNINGMLNTGMGGTIYCGILDDGRVKGLQLTQYNKDHFVASVDDVMSKYRPEVNRCQYKVKFIPVIEAACTKEELDRILRYDSTSSVDPRSRCRNHLLRSQQYCWCDKDKVALINNGTIPPKYVIELILKPWKESDTRNLKTSSRLSLHPVYESEDGDCHIRRNASTTPLDPDQIYNMGKQDAIQYYEGEMARLKEQIRKVESGSDDLD